MGRDRCVLSWAMFGISMACFTAVFPYTLAWNEPGAAIQACLCALLLLYSALSSLFSARGMAVPGGRKMSIFSLLFAIMLFGCVISKAGDVLLSAAAFLLSAVLSLALYYLAERPSYPRTPIPEMASAIFVLLIAAVIVAIFYILAISPRAGEGESALQSIEINQSDEVLEDDDVEEIVINEPPEAIPLHDEPSDDRFSTQEDTSMTSMQDAAADTAEAPAVPPAPTMLGAVITSLDTEADVPSAPSFIGPVVSDVDTDLPVLPAAMIPAGEEAAYPPEVPEEPAAFSDGGFFSGLSPEEADFWAAFYIEGEDELLLEDGAYYMDLYINGTYVGAIDTEIIGGEPHLGAGTLESYLSSSITIDAQDRIFMNTDPYLSLAYLQSVGVQTSFDSVQYRIDLSFSTIDMPIQILSIRQTSPRVQTRPISGAANLDPAVFTLASEYIFSFRVPNFLDPEFWNSFQYSFDVRNRARLFDVYLDFSYYLDWTHHSFDFTMGSYRFYVDFPDQMIRLSWGNVSTSLLSPEGTDFGIRFDKSLSYADSGYTRRNGYEQVIEVPVRSEVTIYNNGDGRADNQIFRRTLDAGVYRLMDFILYSGANRILIRIEPLDGSPVREFVMDIQYSASLLQPGEVYYGASLTTGRIERDYSDYKADSTVSFNIWPDKRIDYDWRNLTLEGYVRAGLTNSLTGDFSLAVQNLPNENAGFRMNAQAAIELTHENVLGTTRYNFNLYEYADDFGRFTEPYFRVRIGHQANTGFRPINSITFSLGYDSPQDFSLGTNHDLSFDIGLSGSYGIFSWSASAALSTDVTDWSEFTWSTLLSTSFHFTGNISMNASLNISGGVDSTPYVGGRVGFTFRFGRNTIYATASESYATLDYDYYDDRNSFSASVDTSSYTSVSGLGFGADYSYSGDIFKVSADLALRGLADTLSSSVRISTSSIFADGYLAFASSIPDNFIIVSQGGSLRNNRLSIGAVNSSATTPVATALGTGIYTDVSSPTSLMIFSEGDSVFSPVYSEAVNLRSSRQKGYVFTIDREDAYSVSGTVELPDGSLWINGASPVYAVDIDEDGLVTLSETDKYIFSDSNGRFVMTDLSAGLWAFDAADEDGWHLYIFETGEAGASATAVKVVDGLQPADGLALEGIYIDAYRFTAGMYMDDEAFFAMLYPQQEAV